MADTSELPGSALRSSQRSAPKAYEIMSCTIKKPPYAYAHLRVQSDNTAETQPLDALQARSYCASALQQFLGITGAAVTVDLLKVAAAQGEFWVRVPGPDLGRFSAAVTAWTGSLQSGTTTILRIVAAGDWLGSLVGRGEQQSLWRST